MRMQDIEDSYPLSPMQKGMLFHSCYSPHSGAYVQQMVGQLHENLDVPAFCQAWQGIGERHGVLRTGFRFDCGDEPVQEVYRHIVLPLEERDWRMLSAVEAEQRLGGYLEADRRRGFDLSNPPLMRLALFRLADSHYQLVWTSHHALFDGRSRLILLKEFFTLYEAFRRGQQAQLKQPRPYKDYIEWLGKQNLSRSEDFWRGVLKGISSPTPLVLDGNGNSKSNAVESRGFQEIRLSNQITLELNKLAEQHQLTLNTLLQGAWATLLNQYSGEEEVVFGATRACRGSGLDGVAAMVGLFVNTVPVRLQVPPEMMLLPWLKKLRTHWVEMRDHEHTPLSRIQECSGLPSAGPLFESILSFEKYELNSALRAWDKSFALREFRLVGRTNYPLTISAYLDHELLLQADYDRHRFNDLTITRMLRHFQTLLEAMLSNPGQRLSELPVLGEKERQQILIEWNNTSTKYPTDQGIHELFEAQAKRTPDAVAVVFEAKQTTYQELNSRANQLAHHLKKRGIGPESLVAICMERSTDMIVAMLGILKAGGAYVPLDPECPKERQSLMLEDIRARVLLTEGHQLERLPKHIAEIICLDRDWNIIAREHDYDCVSSINADSLAYVIYTSGSTGIPKGVAVPHRAVNRLVLNTNYVKVGPSDCVAQVSNCSFDAATFEIWGALLQGACLVGVTKEAALSPRTFAAQILEQKVSTMFLTTALFNQLASEVPRAFKTLHNLLIGGEAMDPRWTREVLRHGAPKRLLNAYGPTESTTFASCYLVQEIADGIVNIPIGRPISNTQMYLLDSRLRPVPVGVTGELYIGGDGLARCYLNRPELTAEKFIPHPFSPESGSRLYCTGDLACYQADGNIEFRGRVDNQVKIRGFRVELGEMEAALNQHHSVRQSIVIADEGPDGTKSLSAYIVARERQPLQAKELRDFLKTKLPEYMIPTKFSFLESFPLTKNGKVDRKRLPILGLVRHEETKVSDESRTPIEQALVGIWRQVLGKEKIGIHDNFFELGGYSLLATRVVSLVQRLLEMDISVRQLFDAPTVASLAASIGHEDSKSRQRQRGPIRAMPRTQDIPLSPRQEYCVNRKSIFMDKATLNICRILRLRGVLQISALQSAFNDLLARHESLRTTFSVSPAGVPVQVIHPEQEVTIPLVDISDLAPLDQEKEARRLADEEGMVLLRLEESPLRLKLIRCQQKEHWLLIVISHLFADGWSVKVLFRELGRFYTAHCKGEKPDLPALSIQFADFVLWQKRYLQSEREKLAAYWKQRLGGCLGLRLPFDRPRVETPTLRAGRETVFLPAGLQNSLSKLGQQQQATEFMVLLAAFNALLYLYTGQVDIVVGSSEANRGHAETADVIGWFSNIILFRSDLSGDPTFRQLLNRVRNVVLESHQHQGLSLELLELECKADDSRGNPQYQCRFVEAPDSDLDLQMGDLEVELVPREHSSMRHDLRVFMGRTEQGIEMRWDYSSDLFDIGTIQLMQHRYLRLLEEVVLDPNKLLSDFSLKYLDERQENLCSTAEIQALGSVKLGSTESSLAPISRTAKEVPLSFAQQRLWFLDQLEPGSSAYNINQIFRLVGPLELDALQAALNAIVARHEALRTTFISKDGDPVQVIAQVANVTIPVVNVQGFSWNERYEEAERRATAEGERPFELSRGPLFRAILFRLAENDHLLLLSMHHIVSDGWSLGVLQQELSALYSAYSKGEPAGLPELPIQYSDYAVWQRQGAQLKNLDSQLAYWKRQLSGCVSMLRLPTDWPRPETQTCQGGRQTLTLTKAFVDSLEAVSRREGCTLFMTLLAVFKLLLHRVTLQDDIIVGVPTAGRGQPETEGLIGFFVNTLALRTNMSGNPTFRELLHRVLDSALGAFSHQDYPFEKLVEELHPERSLRHTPLFQVMLNMWNSPQNKFELSGLRVETVDRTGAQSKFDLTLYIWEQDEALRLSMVYNANLFEQTRMKEFVQQFNYLLEQIKEDMEKPIRSYSLVTPQFRTLLPDPTARLFEPSYELVTTSFVSWAKSSPTHPAICQGQRAWAYEELSTRAQELAQALLRDGMQCGEVVAVAGPKSFGIVSSMMGVLLGGGVLLPIDRNLPPSRQRLFIREAHARRVCYVGDWRQEDHWMHDFFPNRSLSVAPSDGRVLHSSPISKTESMHLPDLHPDNPAYIFFTSGTSGVPKGVLGCHKGLSHFLTWQKETFEVGPNDRCAQLTNLSFDVIFRDIFLPLVSGATLCLPEETDATAFGRVLSWLSNERITILHVVPSLAKYWLANSPANMTLKTLRWVFFAGEALTDSLVQQWREAFPGPGQIVNLYGPTETTMAKCFHVVPPKITAGVQPVGRPLPQTQALVLTENAQLCGLGEPGEIVIRTPFRTLGYINAAEEQQERFVPNPFRDDPKDIIYFTGDQGRYLPDGSLEILSRLDDQVKIRGVRIEPGEVTAILCQHPLVKSCIVIARKNQQEEDILVAYVIPSRRAPGTTAELKSYLTEHLPSAMVPSAFVFMENIPLNSNGKVNRSALPPPESPELELEKSFVAPQTPLEETMANIWCQVLGLNQVGIHDNFFDLGGHSLLAMKLSSRMSAATKRDISLKSLFLNPSIAALVDTFENFLPLEEGSGIKDVHRQAFSEINSSVPAEPSTLQPSSPYLKIERRPLLSLFATGKIAPVDSAAVSCLTDSLLTNNNLTRDEVIHGWYDGLPTLTAITETSLGRIGQITVPQFRSELFNDMEYLVDLIVEALELARQIGARTVSFTGLIPSATEYGQAIAKAIAKRRDLPEITTGHATIAATVALTVLRMLEVSGRDLKRERVGFLGLGSIGKTALRLILRCLPHPAEIILCDLYSRLESTRNELVEEFAFRGPVRVVEATAGIPEEFYDATLIVGATDVPEILDLKLVKEGTLIVDDRRPQCLNTEDVVRRFLAQEDILFTEGDTLESPTIVTQLRYLPRRAEQKAAKFYKDAFAQFHPFRIKGCVFSSLLSSRYKELPPTLGLVDDYAALQHYQKLLTLGYRAFDLHCESYVLPDAGIRNFRRRFGCARDEEHGGPYPFASMVVNTFKKG